MSANYNNQLGGSFGHIYKTVGLSEPLAGFKRKSVQKSTPTKAPKVGKTVQISPSLPVAPEGNKKKKLPQKKKKVESLKKKSPTVGPTKKKSKKKVGIIKKKGPKKRKRSILD